MPKPTILIDNREQLPWAFAEFDTERGTLSEGDYTIKGLEDKIVVERKSLGDFLSTVIHDWIRFRKELTRLAGYDCAVIVVEANVEDVLEHRYESAANPLSVIGRAHSCLIDHGVPVLWWGKREQAQLMAMRFLKQCWEKFR